jgi:hypothetical protein
MEICVTRFNNITFSENQNWIKKNNSAIGCIYGCPVKISENILPYTKLIVLEMNNSKNIIEGIGIIENNCAQENKKYYKIYTDNNYNRYIYKSNLRINRLHFNAYEKEVISLLEEYLFKSANHCKRGQGIQKLPKKIINNEEFNFVKYRCMLKNKKQCEINLLFNFIT